MSKFAKHIYNSNINGLSLRENLIICHNSLVFRYFGAIRLNRLGIYEFAIIL